MASRRYNLLPPYLAANPAWVQLVESIDEVFEKEVDLPTELLSRIRDNWILGVTGAEKIGNEQMLDNTDWFRFERETLIRQANFLGFLLKETDLLSDDEYQRLVRNLGAFWFNKGTPEFKDFMQFILGCIVDIKKLFALPGPTYDTYGYMREEGDPLIGKLNWQTEEILTPLLPGDADTTTDGGTWTQGPNIYRSGIITGPTGLQDAVVYKSFSLATAAMSRSLALDNMSQYRYELWLRRMSATPNLAGGMTVVTDMNSDGVAETQTFSLAGAPLVWRKYQFDFTTGTYATSVADLLSFGNWDIGTSIAVARPQLYKVTNTGYPGQWFETSHVNMIVDPMTYQFGSMQKLIALFNVLANYHLVLNAIVFDTPIWMHPPGDTIGAITKAYPMIDIETTFNNTEVKEIEFLSGNLDGSLAFTRADATPVATRRRTQNAVGPNRTNNLTNNTGAGAVAGVIGTGSGVLPTNWAYNNKASSGLDTEIVGIGTENGIPYVDLHVFGTATSTFWTVNFATSALYPVVTPGAHSVLSLYLSRIAGTFNNVSIVYIRQWDRDSASGAISNGQTDTTVMSMGTGPLSEAQRYLVKKVHGATAAKVSCSFEIGCNVGAAIDFTVRIGGVQHEWGDIATPLIQTTGAVASTTNWPRTNKCNNANANPVQAGAGTMRVAASDPSLLITVEDDSKALRAAGLDAYCKSGKAYKAVNTGGVQRFVQVGGTTGNVAQHTGSAWVRGGTGTMRNGYAVGTAFAASTSYVRRTNTFTPGATTDQLWIGVDPGQTVWFILNQLEEGNAATAIITGDVLGAQKVTNAPPYGDFETVAANVPRFDTNPDGTPRGLLMEPGRASLLKDTRDLTTANWTKVGTAPPTVTPNALPALGRFAQLVTRGTGASSYMQQSDNSAAGTYTAVLLAHAGTVGNRLGARIQGTYPNRGDAVWDLSTGTLVGAQAGGTASGAAGKIDALGDGWYLCYLTVTLADAVSSFLFSPCDNAATVGGWEASSATASNVYILDAWMEPGGWGSKEPLVDAGSELTRAMESLNAANLAGLVWNPVTWSCYLEWEQGALPPASYWPTVINLNGGSNSFQVYVSYATGNLIVKIQVAGVTTYENLPIATPVAVGQRVKVALALTPTGFSISINGGAVQTVATTIPMSTFTNAFLGCLNTSANQLCGWLRRFKGYGIVLSAAKLQELTS